jgi:methyltransferase (TIGR00027 family)
MPEPLITGVPDTAFMVAAWRAQESERPDAIFRDPYAVRLAGERGQAIGQLMRANRIGQWHVIIRTVIIDQLIRDAVTRGVGTVLNLGAGLDARPYRLAWPTSLRWIEVDFPQTIAWKEEILRDERPSCQVERVALDLADRPARNRLLADVAASSPATLVLTEGVVPYLTNEAVGELADDLLQLRGASWIVDYFSKETARARRRAPAMRHMRAAPFRFQPGDWFGFFAGHGWKPTQTKHLGVEGRRLGRPAPLPLWVRLLLRVQRLLAPPDRRVDMRKFAGYVVLEPTKPSKEQV